MGKGSPISEAHLSSMSGFFNSLSVTEGYGTHVTDSGYLISRSPEVELMHHGPRTQGYKSSFIGQDIPRAQRSRANLEDLWNVQGFRNPGLLR